MASAVYSPTLRRVAIEERYIDREGRSVQDCCKWSVVYFTHITSVQQNPAMLDATMLPPGCSVPPDIRPHRNLNHRYLAPNQAPVHIPISIGVAASPNPVIMPCSKKPILACCSGCPVGFSGLIARSASCDALNASFFDDEASSAANSACPNCLLVAVSFAACGRQIENISGVYRRLMLSGCCGKEGAAGPTRSADGIVLTNEASALMN